MRLRHKTPSRRDLTTRNPTKNWALHKTDLQEDFNNYCGYCNSYDGFRHTYYEVDHFVPKDLIIKNGWAIGLTQYSNLVYSCKFCNNNKLAYWPSNSYIRYHFRGKGFYDPCDVEYDKQFYRTSKGEIRGKTRLGKWMCQYAFKFDERKDGIILLWQLDSLRRTIEALNAELSKHKSNSKIYGQIDDNLNKFARNYYRVHKELIEFYNQ
jgi:hypothetical protein